MSRAALGPTQPLRCSVAKSQCSRDPRFMGRDPRSMDQDQRSRIQDPEPRTQDPGSATPDPRPPIHNDDGGEAQPKDRRCLASIHLQCPIARATSCPRARSAAACSSSGASGRVGRRRHSPKERERERERRLERRECLCVSIGRTCDFLFSNSFGSARYGKRFERSARRSRFGRSS